MNGNLIVKVNDKNVVRYYRKFVEEHIDKIIERSKRELGAKIFISSKSRYTIILSSYADLTGLNDIVVELCGY